MMILRMAFEQQRICHCERSEAIQCSFALLWIAAQPLAARNDEVMGL